MPLERQDIVDLAGEIITKYKTDRPDGKLNQIMMILFLLVLGWFGATTYKTSLDIAVLKTTVLNLVKQVENAGYDRYRGSDAAKDKSEVMDRILRIDTVIEKHDNRISDLEKGK